MKEENNKNKRKLINDSLDNPSSVDSPHFCLDNSKKAKIDDQKTINLENEEDYINQSGGNYEKKKKKNQKIIFISNQKIKIKKLKLKIKKKFCLSQALT